MTPDKLHNGEGPAPEEVRAYLERLPAGGAEVSFLARGEYSLNYRSDGLVARLVTGSQIWLPLAEQAVYEYRALELLAASGVTPVPYHVDPAPSGLPYPVIVEEYLPGRPLDYSTDLAAAARCVAEIHELGVPDKHHLQLHPDPAPSVLSESRQLVEPYMEWDEAPEGSKRALRGAFGKVEGYLEEENLFSEEDLAIVNYDLNTHNFVVDRTGGAKLLDWEKARVAPRTEDVAHFLIPTTTLWRGESAALLSEDQEEEFIETYLSHSRIPDKDRFMAQLSAMRVMISLRAVSWCAWALQETERESRPITNEETINKCRTYLEPDFLENLFGR